MSKEEMIEWLKALRKCIDFYAIQKTEEDLTLAAEAEHLPLPVPKRTRRAAS